MRLLEGLVLIAGAVKPADDALGLFLAADQDFRSLYLWLVLLPLLVNLLVGNVGVVLNCGLEQQVRTNLLLEGLFRHPVLLEVGTEVLPVLVLVRVVFGIDLLVGNLLAVFLLQDLVQNHLLKDLLPIAGLLHAAVVLTLGDLPTTSGCDRLVTTCS